MKILSKRIVCVLAMVLFISPIASTSVMAAGDDFHISVDNSRADRLDLDNDGDSDTIRVVYLLNTTSHYAEAAVQVDVEHSGMTLSFWDNTTFNRTSPYFSSQDVEAWGDGVFTVRMKVWDAESNMIIHSEDFGDFDLKASLTQPYLRLDLEASGTIFLGDDCIIERIFLDEVGERYDAIGTISLTGTPWIASNDLSDIDCSAWPARDYHLVMFYRNLLGFSTETELDFTIHTLPPPIFTLNVTGNNDDVGSECVIAIEPSIGTTMALMIVQWDITDPRGDTVDVPGFTTVDCRLWKVGLSKVRVTVTSSEGQSTLGAINLVRLPPKGDVSSEVLEAAGPANMWPDRSLGEEYEPTPFIGNSEITAQSIVAVVGLVIAILFGILCGVMWNRRNTGEMLAFGEASSMEMEPESEGLPSYVDPTGVHWRQHPEGNVDWFDTVSGQWVPYEDEDGFPDA